MRRRGLRSVSLPAATSAVPGLPPSRKTDASASAAAAVSVWTSVDPATRSGNGVPCNPPAQINGIPSATIRSAEDTSSRTCGDARHCRRISRLAVQIHPPRPEASSPRMSLIVSLSDNAATSRPISRMVSGRRPGRTRPSPRAAVAELICPSNAHGTALLTQSQTSMREISPPGPQQFAERGKARTYVSATSYVSREK